VTAAAPARELASDRDVGRDARATPPTLEDATLSGAALSPSYAPTVRLSRFATGGRSGLFAQAKLTVDGVGDPLEREAEWNADAVMATPGPEPAGSGATATGASIAREGAPGALPVSASTEAQITALAGRGAPLPPSTRGFFEPRFGGQDFSSVRVHTGPDAAATATALDARAFTVGSDIFFGAGEYRPETRDGQRLLAHELTHTVQQAPGRAARSRVQRLFEGLKEAAIGPVLGLIRDLARKVPAYTLLTVFLGRDPITDKTVERNGVNLVRGVLELVPDGDAIFKDLQANGTIEKTMAWLDPELARLDLSWDRIKGLFRQAWDALSLSDVIANPGGAWEKLKGIFGPALKRLRDFAVVVGGKLVAAIKAAVLGKLAEWAKKIPGYGLVRVILGKDPFTDEVVPRTAKNFVRAFLELVPGGAAIFENLEKAGTIDRTVAWLDQEIAKLDLTWQKIKGLFARAWDALVVRDLLNIFGLIEKIRAIFEDPAKRVIAFTVAVGKKVLEFIFEGAMFLAGPMGQQIVRIVQKAGAAFNTIVADPVAFLGNLLRAVKMGFQQFSARILQHLKEGLIAWLVGSLEGAGLKLPAKWDLAGVLSLVLQILGLTWEKMRAKLVKIVGEPRMQMLEKAFEFITLIVTKGLAAAWAKILESIGNFWDTVIGGIRDWAISKIVTAAVAKLATMFNPVGAVIQAIITIYNTVAFFVERIKQILALVEAVVDSIANIAAGKLSAAADYVEKSMARTIPVILGFLSRLIGLGDVSGAFRKVITAIQAKVEQAIDKVIAWVVEKAKALFAKAKAAVGAVLEWWKARKRFKTKDGVEHQMYFEGAGRGSELIVATTPQRMSPFFKAWDKGIEDLTDANLKNAQAAARKNAGGRYEKVKALQKQLDPPPTDEGLRQKLTVDLNGELQELANTIALYDVGTAPPLPPPILAPFVSGVLPPKTQRWEYFGRKETAGGTEPGNAAPKGWSWVQAAGLTAQAGWVRAHLLPARLGGKGVDSNLVPASGPLTNIKGLLPVEDKAFKALNAAAKSTERETIIWYEVVVGDLHPVEGDRPLGFPKTLQVSWGGYQATGKTWRKKPATTAKTLSGLDPPQKGNAPLIVNEEGRVRVHKVIGERLITDYVARQIVDLAGAKSFTGPADVVTRLTGAGFQPPAGLGARLQQLYTGKEIDFRPRK
jgi:hypothetical protein